MKISILSVFPELYTNFLKTSLVRRAAEKGIVEYSLDSFSSFVKPKERIDAPIFGPGAGMLIKPEVVQRAIETKEKKFGKAFKIFFSPQGKKLDQNLLREISESVQKVGHVILLPSRYEGMDCRAEDHYADEIISVGDFVLMGGDLPAMMFIEGFLRFIPGVVGKAESVQMDSFSGPLVDYPSYCEPIDWNGYKVPDIIRSGNHEKIRKWRMSQAAKKTVESHFNWMRSNRMTQEHKELAKEFIPNHYVVLMHTDVLVGKEKRSGETSVTSLDIHDIARSAGTFGVKNYFIVTPLIDQQKIVKKMLDFWVSGVGLEYNKSRAQSVKNVRLSDGFDSVVKVIEEKEGCKPLVVATSAKQYDVSNLISFYDQEKVWASKKPVLLVFGTGQGLSESILKEADFILTPIEGFSDYNHLSVRSAAAIVLDRWLGINVKKVK